MKDKIIIFIVHYIQQNIFIELDAEVSFTSSRDANELYKHFLITGQYPRGNEFSRSRGLFCQSKEQTHSGQIECHHCSIPIPRCPPSRSPLLPSPFSADATSPPSSSLTLPALAALLLPTVGSRSPQPSCPAYAASSGVLPAAATPPPPGIGVRVTSSCTSSEWSPRWSAPPTPPSPSTAASARPPVTEAPCSAAR